MAVQMVSCETCRSVSSGNPRLRISAIGCGNKFQSGSMRTAPQPTLSLSLSLLHAGHRHPVLGLELAFLCRLGHPHTLRRWVLHCRFEAASRKTSRRGGRRRPRVCPSLYSGIGAGPRRRESSPGAPCANFNSEHTEQHGTTRYRGHIERCVNGRCYTCDRQERAPLGAAEGAGKRCRNRHERSGKRTDVSPHWREAASAQAPVVHRRGKAR